MTADATGLVSGEGVRLALVPAGVGSRTVAAAIDAALQAVAFFVLTLIDFAVAGSGDSASLRALIIVELVAVVAGYPIVLETTTRGRTVGKMCLGLRVVRDDGGPIVFRQALVRGLASLVLEKPGLLFPLTTLAGLVTLTVSRQEKRIGDFLAGTIVLDERASPQPLAMPHAWVPYPMQTWAMSVDLHRLDDVLALRVRQFVSRAYAMSPAAQAEIGGELLRRVLAVVSPPPPAGAPVADILGTVLAERRRRAVYGLPATPTPVAAPPSVPPPAAAPSSPFTAPQ